VNNVQTLDLQTDGKIIIGGEFTNYDNISCGRFARINTDGTLDQAFSSGSGANLTVHSTEVQSDGKIMLGGWFTSYNGVTRNRIARLNSDGSLDTTFDPGVGPSYIVRTISVQTDNKVVIGGEFTTVDTVGRNYIARLNSDGSLDTTFNPGLGADFRVYSSLIQPDGKILIGGMFDNYDGVARKSLARLDADGSLDLTFDPGVGPAATSGLTIVHDLALQTDGKIIVVGNFSTYNGASQNKIIRLNADGSVDPSFNIGTGASNSIHSVNVRPNGKIIITGSFQSFNGTAIGRVARLNTDGSLDTEFMPVSGANGRVLTSKVQPDEKVVIGGEFDNFDGLWSGHFGRLYGCSLGQPSEIFGQTENLCSNSEQLYVSSPVADAESYVWTLPNGWSGTSSTDSLMATVGSDSGFVFVSAYSDACGLRESQLLAVNVIPAPSVTDICLVTVDTTSTHNVVYWEKPVSALIDSFLVYREVQTNVFDHIGSVAYDSLSQYHDYAANPNATSYKYKLSVLDVCGMESAQSDYHKSIHLQNLGNGNLSWTLYEIENTSNPVTFYRVNRDDFGTNNFQPINSSIPGGNSTFTDVDFNSFPDANYVVDVNWSILCTPSRETVNTTRSNLLFTTGGPVGIGETENHISIYPNPAIENLYIDAYSTGIVSQINIIDSYGKLVFSKEDVSTATIEIDLTPFSSGIYIIQLIGSKINLKKKLIVQ